MRRNCLLTGNWDQSDKLLRSGPTVGLALRSSPSRKLYLEAASLVVSTSPRVVSLELSLPFEFFVV